MSDKIKDALSKLEAQNDNHWTADGLPRLDTLKLLAKDPALTREAVNEAFPGFTRALAAQVPPQAPAAAPSDHSTDLAANAAPAAALRPTSDDPDLPNLGSMQLAARDPADLEALDARIAEGRKVLTHAQAELQAAQEEVHAISAQLDKLIDQRALLVKPGEENHKAIQGYLAQQRRNLEERGVRQQLIAESGINLQALARNMKSPLDQAIASRKRLK